jgi:DNA excision repair protein ERCC-4
LGGFVPCLFFSDDHVRDDGSSFPIWLHARYSIPLATTTHPRQTHPNRTTRTQNGFLKAFSDEPELFTFGIAPLQSTMKNLCLRRVHLWPR